jgi:hypothetical protein
LIKLTAIILKNREITLRRHIGALLVCLGGLIGNSDAFAGDGVELVSVVVATNTTFKPRTMFTQRWTMQNTGTTTWSAGESPYTLRLVGADSLGVVPITANENASSYVPLAPVDSGRPIATNEQGTFSMTFIAPEPAGSYTDTFQLYNASGVAFGPVVTMQIVVPRYGSTNQYDRARAVSYANTYAGYVVSDGYFWTNGSDYYDFGAGAPVPTAELGDDCAHFCSCCIGSQANKRGGGLNIPSRVPPTYGEPGAAHLVNTCLIAPGYATEVFDLSELSPGDLIGWNWEGDTNIADLDHVTPYLGNNLLASHAESALDVSATSFFQESLPDWRWHLIHIYDAPSITSSMVGKNLILSWGTNWTGYTLYSATNLSPAATWTKVSKSPTKVGALNMMTNTIGSGLMFYRLMLP